MASWRRRPEESYEQYTAFEYYVELGPLRDREDVTAAIRSMRSSTARAKADQVYDWYYRFSWRDRARDYDRYQESQLRWYFRKKRIHMFWLIDELVMMTLEAMLRKMVNDPQSFSFNELRLWLDTYAKLRSILVADEVLRGRSDAR